VRIETYPPTKKVRWARYQLGFALLFGANAALGQVLVGPPPANGSAIDACLGRLIESARHAQDEGRPEEALRAFLAIPGCEQDASGLALKDPVHLLPILQSEAGDHPMVCALVQGDLALKSGDLAKALVFYRRAAATVESAGYPVEIDGAGSSPIFNPKMPRQPFLEGPGSHRDNWLIRRFIALNAWEDVGQEYQRVWQLHQDRSHGGQLNALGLQFALDYSSFLALREEPRKAQSILADTILRMDYERNVNWDSIPDRGQYAFPRAFLGVTRTEFLQRASNLAASLGFEAGMTQRIEDACSSHPTQRRVLAKLLLLKGRRDEAQKEEQAFLEEAPLNGLTKIYRRALFLETGSQFEDAVALYEKALTIPFVQLDLPETDEEAVAAWARLAGSSQMFIPPPNRKPSFDKVGFHADLLDRIIRIDRILGRQEGVLNATLLEFENQPDRMKRVEDLDQARSAFSAAGKEAVFTEWARHQVGLVKETAAKVSMCWVAQEIETAIQTVAANTSDGWLVHTWRDRFSQGNLATYHKFLEAVIKANPKDGRSRLERLALDGQMEGPEATAAMELVLVCQDPNEFPYSGHGKSGGPARFKEPYDLAFQLMKRYELARETKKMETLALRIARGDHPFERSLLPSLTAYGAWPLPEGGRAALDLAVLHAEGASFRKELGHALEGSPWDTASRSLQRRDEGTLPTHAMPGPISWMNVPTTFTPRPMPWVNLGSGATLIASLEDVLDLARDDKHLYAGQPWGVAVYDLRGNPIQRVALGGAATNLAVAGRNLFVGTPSGLLSVDTEHMTVSCIGLPPGDENVCGLAVQGGDLWVGTHQRILKMDTKTFQATEFNSDDLGVQMGDWSRFVFDPPYVWAKDRRYDPFSRKWEYAVENGRAAPVRLIGRIGGRLWGWISRDGNHDVTTLCLVDSSSLKVTTVPFVPSNPNPVDPASLFDRITFWGELKGQPVFNGWVFDPAAMVCRHPITEEEFRSRRTWENGTGGWQVGVEFLRPDGISVAAGDVFHGRKAKEGPLEANRWVFITLPDGTCFVGGGHPSSPRWQYPEEELKTVNSPGYDVCGSGGLFIQKAGEASERISSPLAGSLPGNSVFSAMEDKAGRMWVGTTEGVQLLDHALAPITSFGPPDGQFIHGVCKGAMVGGDVFFRIQARERFGKQVDQTLVFDARANLFREPNGPVSQQVRVALDQSPETFSHGLESPVPVLGGKVLSSLESGGRTIICGTRGMVVLSAASESPMPFQKVQTTPDPESPREQQKAADAYVLPSLDSEGLGSYLKDSNPFLVAKALASCMVPVSNHAPGFLPLVSQAMTNPNTRVRWTAVSLLALVDRDDAIQPLQDALRDSDPQVRAVAAAALARHGHLPDLSVVEEILQRGRNGYGNLPFGSSSSIGAAVDVETFYQDLAPLADESVVALFVNYPPYDYVHAQPWKGCQGLGKALLLHPASVDLLLKARKTLGNRTYTYQFVEDALVSAGKGILPKLHEGLGSWDPWVRTNAARSCGALDDPESVRPLIDALKFDDVEPRVAILEALKRLKAIEAVPQLIDLYFDLRRGEVRATFGHALRPGIPETEILPTFKSDGLSETQAAWQALKAQPIPGPTTFVGGDFLDSEKVLKTIQAIWPAGSPRFFQRLAGNDSVAVRLEAAQDLADSTSEDRKQSLACLKALLVDRNPSIQVTAAASLIVLGDPQGQKILAKALAGDLPVSGGFLMQELERIKDGECLVFARSPLEKWATDRGNDPDLGQRIKVLLRRIPPK
jgi:HEAT repeat protein/tetratricopeptide (TPR) repeat protein